MKILGVIPARGGSKRVPRKNMAIVGGKPLIKWTIEAAEQSGVLDQIVVTTEDPEIGNVFPQYWHKRPISLAQDNTPTLPVIQEVFEHYKADVVVTLQPTSPFRTAEDIKQAIELLQHTKGDSVISVTEAPSDLAFEVGFANRLRTVPKIVIPNGAIYILTGEALLRGETWYSGVVYGYSMPKERSLYIDNGQDLEIARYIANNNPPWLTPWFGARNSGSQN